MHHDHLMDFVLDELRRITPSPSVALDVWQKRGGEFKGVMRFMPVMICAVCNTGDGWAKTAGWCGIAETVYPDSFSMTVQELGRMRDARPGAPRRAMATTIWREVGLDHRMRLKEAREIARRLVKEAASRGDALRPARSGRSRPELLLHLRQARLRHGDPAPWLADGRDSDRADRNRHPQLGIRS